MSEIPYGYCQCGCGQQTTISKGGNGYKVGEAKAFINHHASRLTKSEVFPKECAICGKVFLPPKKSRQESRVTCSAKCRNKYNNHQSLEQRADMLRGRGKGKSYTKRFGRHEHRIIMEQIIGRPLLPDEIVHHIDGNIHNNNPNNLTLLSREEHYFEHLAKWQDDKRMESLKRGEPA